VRTITLRASGIEISLPEDQGVCLMDSAVEPLVEVSPESGIYPAVPLSIRGKDWLGAGFAECPPLQSISSMKLSAGEFLDAMLESDPDEVLLAVSAWLGIHAGRIRG
jgi:hypothetical protein